jgi:hypothetical protein
MIAVAIVLFVVQEIGPLEQLLLVILEFSDHRAVAVSAIEVVTSRTLRNRRAGRRSKTLFLVIVYRCGMKWGPAGRPTGPDTPGLTQPIISRQKLLP